MSQQIRYQLWIAAAASVIFFTNLGAAGLWDMDEALYTSCAREMYQRENWVVPWFNGQMFPEKPPLMFWTMIAGFELFGVNEFGARFFSAVMGVGTALAAFHLGRLLFNVRVGLWTGLITASTIIFTVSARAATVDSALTFVTTLAMLLFVLAKRPGARGQGLGVSAKPQAANSKSQIPNQQVSNSQSPIPNPCFSTPPPVPRPSRPLYWPCAALMYACIGLAVLAKGPVGMALPLAAIGLYMLIEGGPRRVFRSAWEMRPLTAIVVIAAVAAPWYVMVGQYNEGEWLRKFFFEFNLRPFRQPILGHGDVSSLQHALAVAVSILYYFYHVPAILFGFFPWSVFLGPTLIHTVQCLRKKPTRSQREKVSELFFSADPLGRETGRKKVSELFFSADPLEDSQSTEKIVLTPFFACVFASCWFGVWLVFWSVCKTKLPHYLLPAYPALALLMACWIDRWLEGPARYWADSGRLAPASTPGKNDLLPAVLRPPAWTPGLNEFSPRWIRNAWISTILTGLGIVIAIPIVAAYYLPGEAIIGLVGLIPVAGGGWCWRLTAQGQNRQAMGVFAVMSVLFLTAMFGFAALRVDRHQNAERMIEAIRKDCGQGKGDRPHLPERPEGCFAQMGPVPFSLATYRFFRESTVYYAGRPVTRCEGDRQAALKKLADFLAGGERSYVIATDRQEREIEEAFPGRLKEIFRHPRFLAPGEMVVLRCEGESESGSTKPDI